ncbi:hypothetical protein D3D02_17905, partial [Halobellus sp. Atlit-38R]
EISESTEYTYGDRHPPKTTEIERLEEGDLLFFYATLDYVDDRAPEHEWINEDWGAYGDVKLRTRRSVFRMLYVRIQPPRRLY